jgi:transcriptional activator HAC1
MEQQGSPASQFFQSPAESLMSAPGDAYTSLFAATTPSAASTVNPMDMLTPKSFNEDSLLPMIKQEEGVASTPSPSPAPEKKTTKKRKSWGQVLPEPKTNLPPRYESTKDSDDVTNGSTNSPCRKRAKTADEKEQRRVERVLRNRRAAQSSRERKRQEVELLEKRNKDLEVAIQQAEQMNARLMEELAAMRKSNGLPPLSKELFSSQTTHQPMETMVSPNATVDPMALSPCLSPVPEESEEIAQQEPAKETILEQSENTSPDLTQRPAAMLSDLQCHMSAEVSKIFQSQSHTISTQPTLAWLLPLQMTLFSAVAVLNFCQRPLTQIAISLKTGISLHPTPQLLTSLVWILTRPRSTSTTASTTNSSTAPSSTTPQTASRQSSRSQLTTPLRSSATSSGSTNLRIKSLRKILSSSPSLARPLTDATLVALRLVSEGCDDRVENSERETEESRGQDELVMCFSEITLPSRELLLTLLWAIRTEEARIQREAAKVLDPETRSPLRVHQPSKKAALSVILEEENNRVQTS